MLRVCENRLCKEDGNTVSGGFPNTQDNGTFIHTK